MEGALADVRAEHERDAVRLRDLHEVTLQRDHRLRTLHLRDLDVDDLCLVVLRLGLATTFPAAATAGATAKAVAIAPVMAMVLMPRSLLIVLMQAA